MLGISRQTDYATRLVLHLACLAPGTQVSIAEIAKLRLLPAPFARRLVSQLIRQGILLSSRGAGGGVRLARPASEITLLDVVRATEGETALNICVGNPDTCVFSDQCSIHPAWVSATRVLHEHLASVRFDALAAQSSPQPQPPAVPLP
jgi:Rrf2 family protein